MSEQIWYKDPITYLTNPEYILKFIPESGMTIEEQLNSISRFTIIFCIIVFCIKHDFRIFILAAFILIGSIVLYEHSKEEDKNKNKIKEHLNIDKNKNTNNYCTKPTKENPFMNVLYNDYRDFPNKPPACMSFKQEVNNDIEQKFNEKYNRPNDDIFEKDGGYRQFYTTPSTTIPNDQDTFARWLYTPKLLYKKNNSKN